MATITYKDEQVIEDYLAMREGNVLDLSHSSLRHLVDGVTDIDIQEGKYKNLGTSKANLLRSFFRHEPDKTVSKLLQALLERRENWEAADRFNRIEPDPTLRTKFVAIITKLRGDVEIVEAEVIIAANDNEDFKALAKTIRDSIEKGEPATALDRLHTFFLKYCREMCSKHKIDIAKDEPLNAVYGKYIKVLREEKMLDSVMGEMIIRSTFQCIQAFNDIRNNKSFAHDNPLLNHEESVLIFNYMTSTLKFLQAVESKYGNKPTEPEKVEWSSF